MSCKVDCSSYPGDVGAGVAIEKCPTPLHNPSLIPSRKPAMLHIANYGAQIHLNHHSLKAAKVNKIQRNI
ncbi:hypothetical protein L195_g006186 [Trifolium pratense]|uniref:Uncharacterized protein n=1 Tax=Trifolium pratense TaxID=57577 RepID=A0A2K3P2W4_TRIPR|nr:hypothetical protein L195_g006186 [Trifolium pratense]